MQLIFYMIPSCDTQPHGASIYNPVKTQRPKVSDLARVIQIACQQ